MATLPSRSIRDVYKSPTINIGEPTFNPINIPSYASTGVSTANRSTTLKRLEGFLPYASNLINSFRRLPKPFAPQTESYTSPSLVNMDAARTRLDNERSNFNRSTDYRVSNPTLAQGLKAKALSSIIEGQNQINQEEANTNAMIRNRSNEFNQGIQARNLQRLSDYNDNLTKRSLAEQQLDSENIANLTDKYQMQKRDRGLMNLEGRKLLVQSLGLDRSTLGPKSLASLDQFTQEELNRLGYKYGGSMKGNYSSIPKGMKRLKR